LRNGAKQAAAVQAFDFYFHRVARAQRAVLRQLGDQLTKMQRHMGACVAQAALCSHSSWFAAPGSTGVCARLRPARHAYKR